MELRPGVVINLNDGRMVRIAQVIWYKTRPLTIIGNVVTKKKDTGRIVRVASDEIKSAIVANPVLDLYNLISSVEAGLDSADLIADFKREYGFGVAPNVE